MGRIVKLTHRVEYRTNLLAMGKVAGDGTANGKAVHIQGWRGRATEALLADWRKAMNKSFQAGGSNAHISEAFGAVEHISWARIVHQDSGRVVAEVTMPTFEVV